MFSLSVICDGLYETCVNKINRNLKTLIYQHKNSLRHEEEGEEEGEEK
jgi:hypothetical protein